MISPGVMFRVISKITRGFVIAGERNGKAATEADLVKEIPEGWCIGCIGCIDVSLYRCITVSAVSRYLRRVTKRVRCIAVSTLVFAHLRCIISVSVLYVSRYSDTVDTAIQRYS